MALVLVAILTAGVVAFDVVMETNIVSSRFESLQLHTNNTSVYNGSTEGSTCSPSVVNVSAIEYHSGHRYYPLLQNATPLAPPRFQDEHAFLCNESRQHDLKYSYCLPISGRKDSPFCTGADRMDLLTPHSAQSRCYASVLHMLLIEVYEELHAFGRTPVLVYGSLLGAVRNGSMIPFTEDTDIAYSGQLDVDGDIGRALVAKGYHFFHYGIWRVCVAPTHPLAARLYDPSLPITSNFMVPYLDLYAMDKLNDTDWSMECFSDSTLPHEKIQPFSQVKVNGLSFDTVADPNYFLRKMYGEDYMTPTPRK
uniref:RxLR effector candidate protein n=1 Tax=Hyaloperonospora arabidopsidis (strain Emoy2) TaxID=559515 RepID=M4BGY0_HYAAE